MTPVCGTRLKVLYKESELASVNVENSGIAVVRLTGIEPAHAASEAAALSTELQAHINATLLIIPFIIRIVNRS